MVAKIAICRFTIAVLLRRTSLYGSVRSSSFADISSILSTIRYNPKQSPV